MKQSERSTFLLERRKASKIIERMEQITPRLRRSGGFYELDGEPIRREVGRPRVERGPFEVLWELRQFAIETLGVQLPDDSLPDEPVRRTVGKIRAR